MHLHIFHFIDLLREDHEYQHYKLEESRVQLRKRKKVNDDIEVTLELLLNEHKIGSITDMQFAIKCGRVEDKTCRIIFFSYSLYLLPFNPSGSYRYTIIIM